YQLTDDAGGRFAIDGSSGEITVADGSLLDHETAASHDVTVRVTDASGASYDETFTIAVGDVAENITLADGGVTFTDAGVTETSVTGGSGDDVITGGAGADSLDGGSSGWDTLDGGGAGDTYYAIGDGLADTYADTGSSGTDTIILKSGTGSNFELTDQFDAASTGIEAIDGSAVSGETLRAQRSNSQINWDFSGITLTDVDQIEGRNADDTIIGSAGADTIIGGAGADTIDGGGGTDVAVFSGNWVDYTISLNNGTYSVVDNVGSDGTDTITGVETFRFADGDIAAVDVLNDTPHDLTLSGSSVAENAANGTVVGTASGSDVDAGDTLTYSLTDDADGRFAIDGTSGEITIADGTLLDYETATSHDLTVRVTDAGGLTHDETFTVNVTDVVDNQAPTGLQFKAEAATSTTVVTEDFDSGATGWSDNTTTSGGAGLDGGYLGGFFGTGGAQTVYKTFSLSGDQDSVTVNFDFYEFDTWNGEEFKIWVDDVLVSTDVFYTQQYYGAGDSSTYGNSTSDTSSNLGQGIYNDQTHSYSFTIDSSATSIKVGFGSNLDESASDNTESWGIDNFEIVENQGGTTLPFVQSESETVATGEIVNVGGYKSVDRWSLTHDGGDLTIDMLADGFNGSDLDSIVYLYRDNGDGSYTQIGSNDDGAAGSDGSTSQYDSYLSVSDLASGDYIIAVGSWGTSSSEAISSSDTVTANTTGAYQMTVTGSATLNGIATNPSDNTSWGDPNGNAVVVSSSGGGLDADTTLATLEAVDADSGDSASYSLTNDAGGRYSINASGELDLDVAHDGSSTATDTITVRTTDGAGATYDESIDVALGSNSGETLNGGAGSDIIHGLDGWDTIYAGAGDDIIYGGAGNDNILFGEGDDIVYGGDGDDTIDDEGNERLNGDNVLDGGAGDDRIWAGHGDDILYGGAGDDFLSGEGGSDLFVILQGEGNDQVIGGSGWTDIIELQDANGGSNIGTYGSDWTIAFDSGSIEASDTNATDGWLDLTDDASGTITMQDGTEISFNQIEHIQW
ncbi:MAG: cadherin domain-containing protein, partial [Pseudomonadota bacterium]